MIALGVLAIEAGVAGEAGGLALDATGVGAVIGVPVNVASAGLIVAGAGLVAGGVGVTWDALSRMESASGSGGSSGGGSGSPPSQLRTPQQGATDGGPGQWVKNDIGASEATKAYQERATGVARGNEYEVNGVKFDGYDNGTLIDAKDEYLQFVDRTGNWQSWFRGKAGLIREARGQLEAAQGNPVQWRVSDPRLQEVLERTFAEENITGIQVRYYP